MNHDKPSSARYREIEYPFSTDELDNYPKLSHLMRQGYGFCVLQRLRHPRFPLTHTFILACEVLCSDGVRLMQRFDSLTPEFHTLADLDHFIQHSMLEIMHQHFIGQSDRYA